MDEIEIRCTGKHADKAGFRIPVKSEAIPKIEVDPGTGRVTYTLKSVRREALTELLYKRFAAGGGVILLLIGVVLAVVFPEPTKVLEKVIFTLLALGGAGFANEIAGSLLVGLSMGKRRAIRATGAIGVFVILYFFNPAS